MSEVFVANNPFRVRKSEGSPGAGSNIGYGGLRHFPNGCGLLKFIEGGFYFHPSDEDLRGTHAVGRGIPVRKKPVERVVSVRGNSENAITGRSPISPMHLSPFRKHHGQPGSGPNRGRGARVRRGCAGRDSAFDVRMNLMVFVGRDRRFPASPPMYLPGILVILREFDEVKGRVESQRASTKDTRTEDRNLRRADGRMRGLQICR